MSFESSLPEFACSDCGSPSIRIDGPLCATTAVQCGGCGKHISDWHTFVDETEVMLATRSKSATGDQDKPHLHRFS